MTDEENKEYMRNYRKENLDKFKRYSEKFKSKNKNYFKDYYILNKHRWDIYNKKGLYLYRFISGDGSDARIGSTQDLKQRISAYLGGHVIENVNKEVFINTYGVDRIEICDLTGQCNRDYLYDLEYSIVKQVGLPILNKVEGKIRNVEPIDDLEWTVYRQF